MANDIHCCPIMCELNGIHKDVMNSFIGWPALVMLPQNRIHGILKYDFHWQV